MNDAYVLRKAKVSDLDSLLPIYMDEKVNRFLNFGIISKHELENIFKDLINTEQLFVFENSQHILATCVVTRQKRRAAHVASLKTLAINPKFQREGIGTRFMRELFKKLKNEGINRIDLIVEADNVVAQKFYEKLGFQFEGTLKRYFKRPHEDFFTDVHMMALILE